jgi:hypothetical protein
MKAVYIQQHGPIEGLRVTDRPEPRVNSGEVLYAGWHLRLLCSAHHDRQRWVGGVVGLRGRYRCDDREWATFGPSRILPL